MAEEFKRRGGGQGDLPGGSFLLINFPLQF
jgi:hypothetical protein